MSDVPFLKKEVIEADAAALLAEYGQVTAPPVPIDDIVELHLKVTFEIMDLQQIFGVGDVHGAIWFRSQRVGVDQSLDPARHPAKRGRYHFTLAHEAGHWRLHRHLFLRRMDQPSLFPDQEQKPDYVCQSSEKKKPVEWQADTFAACVLMPRKLIHAAWAEFRGGDDRPVELGELYAAHAGSPLFYRGQPAATDEARDNAVKEDFCRPLAERFEVSREAMRIRLEELELLVRERPATLF